MRPRARVVAVGSMLAACCALAACAPGASHLPVPRRWVGADTGTVMDRVGEEYVKLVLALGTHDPDYVDAYYGPPQWRTAAEREKPPVEVIQSRAADLVTMLGDAPPSSADSLDRLRHAYLGRQLASLGARARMLRGERLRFDEESRALYDAVAPTHDSAYFQRVLDQLEDVLPGDGPLTDRYDAFRQRFVIPPERLDTVFAAAVTACRERTLRYVELPSRESFVVEYVNGKPWSGYNWYRGNYHSLIQVNTDLPIYVDRAVDLACHEGYPGHHVYNALLERRLVRERGWVEFSVYPLFSPQSLIAEGSANFGIAMAFPGAERVEFERGTLFPLAGLEPDEAEAYYRVQDLVHELSYAGNEAARQYLNGHIDAAAAAAWLRRYALMSAGAAEQRVRFFDRYRSYVINYNLGQDLVRDYVAREAGAGASPERRWAVFSGLLASPRLPSDLQ